MALWEGYKWMVLGAISLAGYAVQAQVLQEGSEEQLEHLAGQEEAVQQEDDGNLAGFVPCAFCAIDINRAPLEDWLQLPGMQPAMAQAIIRYRDQFGPFIHLMEIQAVPGLSLAFVRQMMPYLKLGLPNEGYPKIADRLSGGDHVLILRSAQLWQGFDRYPGRVKTHNPFLGRGASLLLRYGYRYGNELQWGFALEKDAGEKIIPGTVWKGMDFNSFHVAARHLGPVRAFVAGDYIVNLGQGLIHWQGMAFGKSVQTIMVNRQGETIKPYTGIDENRYHRGLAVDLGGRKIGVVIFLAADRMDGNRALDSSNPNLPGVSSFQWTGLHRTEDEKADKDAIRQKLAGASLSYRHQQFKFALNGLAFGFGPTILRGDALYQRFNIEGKRWWNLSADYSVVCRNMYLFGELALSPGRGLGIVQGLMAALDSRLDFSILLRTISPAFKSLQSNAFTELSSTSNETGLYLGVQFRVKPGLLFNGYADAWHHPWLRYRVHGPSSGWGGLLSLDWRPSKTMQMMGTYRLRKTQENEVLGDMAFADPASNLLHQYRFQFSFKPNRFVEIRQRWDQAVSAPVNKARGWAQSFEIIGKLPHDKYAMAARISWFSSDRYETRIFQYERDVLNYYSISALDRSGMRAYLVLTADLPAKISFQGKIFCTLYNDLQSIATYSQELFPRLRWGFRVQLIRRF